MFANPKQSIRRAAAGGIELSDRCTSPRRAKVPIVFVRANREIEDGDGSVWTTTVRTESYTLRAGAAGRAPVAIALAARQHIGRHAHRQRLRLRLVCRTTCAYRVRANVGMANGAHFDVARVARHGSGEDSGHEPKHESVLVVAAVKQPG